MQETVTKGSQDNSLGEAIYKAQAVRVVYGKSLAVEITDDTTNESIDKFIAIAVANILKEKPEEQITSEELAKARRALIGIDKLNFQDEFIVTIVDKKKLVNMPTKVTLPIFALTIMSAMSLAADKLVADEQSILIGINMSFKKVKLDQESQDLTVDRWIFFTENDATFFMVEIAYSPQTSQPVKVWEELREMMTSFRALN